VDFFIEEAPKEKQGGEEHELLGNQATASEQSTFEGRDRGRVLHFPASKQNR